MIKKNVPAMMCTPKVRFGSNFKGAHHNGYVLFLTKTSNFIFVTTKNPTEFF